MKTWKSILPLEAAVAVLPVTCAVPDSAALYTANSMYSRFRKELSV